MIDQDVVTSCVVIGPDVVTSCVVIGPDVVASCVVIGPDVVASCAVIGPDVVASCVVIGPGRRHAADHHGRVVQVDPIKPRLKPPGSKHLTLKYYQLVS